VKNGNRNAVAPEVDILDVWIKNDGSSAKKDMAKNKVCTKAYTIEGAEKLPYNIESISKTQINDFILLKPNIHYKLDSDDGYIQFTDSLEIGSNDLVAIYMRSNKDPSLNKGFYFDSTKILWVLKPVDEIDSLAEDPLRYNLMWRNVYSMSGNTEDLTNYKLSIVRKDEDSKEDKQKEYDKLGNSYYAQIIGLADDKGKPLVQNGDIFED
jgi:hypothetical protein